MSSAGGSAPAAPAVSSSGRPRIDRIVTGLICLVVFGVASGLVFAELAAPAGLYGVTQYDDAVYFASALRLTTGSLAYRDFVLVQPPGIAVLMAPFALVSHVVGVRHGIALARIATALVAGANAALIALVLRRFGRIAALVGAGLFAIYPPAYTADHTVMLEPYLVACCLIGVVVAFPINGPTSPRRWWWAGIAFGVGGAVKTWALFPFLAIVVVAALAIRRLPTRLVLGAAVGFVAVCGVFFLAAPHAFVTDVITSQLARQTVRPTPVLSRLWAIVGLSYSSSTLLVQKSANLILAVSSGVGAVLVLGSLVPTLARRAGRLEQFVLGAIALTVASMFVPEQFFDHYAYFSAAFLALGIGIATSRGVNLVVSFGRRFEPRGHLVAVAATASVLGLIGAGSGLVIANESAYESQLMDHFGDPGPSIAASVPDGACAVSDAEALLVSAGRVLTSDPTCPTIVDATGTWITYDPAHPPVRSNLGPKNPALVAEWSQIFDRVDYVVLSGPVAFRIPWTPALRAEFDRRFVRVPGSGLLVYEVRPR